MDEVAGIGNHYTALYWEYDPRDVKRWNLDPKPNASFSNYAVFANNPILFSDIAGDSVNVSKLYQRDENGNLKNKEKVLAFEVFASTADGKAFLLDHAEKGFKLKGEYVCDLDIEATQEGLKSAKGVDIAFAYGMTDHTSPSVESGRLKLSISLNSKPGHEIGRQQWWDKGLESTMRDINAISHEVFLHGDLMERRYFNGARERTLLENEDHSDYIFKQSYYSHIASSNLKVAQIKLLTDSHIRALPFMTDLKGPALNDKMLQMMIDFGRGRAFIPKGQKWSDYKSDLKK